MKRWKYYNSFKYYRAVIKEDEYAFWKEQRDREAQNLYKDRSTRICEDEYEESDEEEEEEAVRANSSRHEESDSENGEDSDQENQENDLGGNRDDHQEDEPDADQDDEVALTDLPNAIVISTVPIPQIPRSLKVVETLVSEVPRSCQEALRAQQHGSLALPRRCPGIPTRKFSSADNETHGSRLDDWPIQVVLENPTNPDNWFVFFEGWASPDNCEEDELRGEALEVGKMRRNFLNVIEAAEDDSIKELVKQQRNIRDAPKFFLDYLDLSYFHSEIHQEYGLGTIIYISLFDTRPPQLKYTTVNVMEAEIYHHLRRAYPNKLFDELVRINRRRRIRHDLTITGGCENEGSCVCNKLFTILYGITGAQNLQTLPNGLIDLKDFNREIQRVAIECSDRCKCSLNCPRRRLQQPMSFPVIVFYEGDKGFGLRAGRRARPGEFLGTYTGIMKKDNEEDNQSYVAGLGIVSKNLVIDALNVGNVFRFAAHCCDPSAVFVEVHSRRNESDLLVPMIAVMAIKNIEFGDEITISYYLKDVLENIPDDQETIDCLCKSPLCFGKLPA
uniref:SET domain-containing protein n=2 Tax=Caenorhabditis tropicalis TaxID=1561998 RepID=A0A1I7U1V5_9PELO